jgi:hypothetical protein
MIKGRGMNQIGNLTPNHKSLKRRGQMRSNWSMLYNVGNIFFKGYKILSSYFQNKFDLKKNGCPKF